MPLPPLPPTPLRALSAPQPWAWALATGVATTANRGRGLHTEHRGPVAIHATLSWDATAKTSPLLVEALDTSRYQHPRDILPRGAILAVRELTGCHQVTTDPSGALTCCDDPWALATLAGQPVTVHLTWGETRVFPRPVPACGQRGWWHVPQTTHTAVMAQYARAAAA